MNIFDAHVTGSLSVSSSAQISGDLTVLGTINATISGTTSNAVSASHAASYLLTSSFGAFTSSYRTGSFTGSFKGDGSGLTNIPASGVTGLNLNKIISGSVSASISPNRGFEVNTGVRVEGSASFLNTISVDEGRIVLLNDFLPSQTTTLYAGAALFGISRSSSGNYLAVSDTEGVLTNVGITAPSITGSINYNNLTNVPTLISGSSQVLSGTTIHSGTFFNGISVVSGSGQISFNGITDKPTLVSGSSQVLLSSGVWSGSAQLPSGIISGSSQLPSGLVSGSSQVDLTATTNYSSGIKTRLNAEGVVSGSSQISFTTISDKPTLVSGSSQVLSGTTIHSGSFFNNITVVSGSSQIDITGTTGYSTFSSSISSSNSIQDNRLTSIEGKTGSISTLNSFSQSFDTAIGLSGANVTIKGNLTVSGTSTTIDSTTVSIGDNIIQLNGTGATNAGLVVRDATAPNSVSGSLLWDTTNDKWIAGPLGSELEIATISGTQTLTNKTINGSQLVNASVANAKLANSSITIAGISTSLGGSITAATILSGTGTVSGSSQVLNGSGVWSGSAQLPNGIISGSSQLPSGLVSGSSQVTYGSLTGIPSGIVSGSSQVLNGSGVWSGSAQLPSGIISGSSQLPSGLVSGSSQVSYGLLTGIPSGIISGSSQVLFGGITNVPSGLVSGSAQVTGIGNGQLTNSSFNIGTTSISLGRASASQTLSGVSIDGNSATVTNGVYTTGDQSIGGAKTFTYVGVASTGTINLVSNDAFIRFRNTLRGTDDKQWDVRAVGTLDFRTINDANSVFSTALSITRTGNVTALGTIGASNFSGTHSGTSSGTNTGDQTNISGTAGGETLATVTGRGASTSTAISINNTLTVTSGRVIARTGGVNTYGVFSGYDNNNHMMAFRSAISGPTATPTFTAGHQTTFVEYAEAGDITGWFFKSSSSTNYEEIARITKTGINWNGNTVYHSGNVPTWNQNTTGTASNITSYTINQNLGTGNNVKFASHVDLNVNGSAFRFYDGSTFRGGLGLDDWAHSGSAANVTVYATGVLHFTSGGTKRAYFNTSGHFLPDANATYDIGSTGNRWRTIYTSDLSLSNGIGDYTIVEGEEKLYLYNNKNKKVYSFVLQEEDPKTATPKLPQ